MVWKPITVIVISALLSACDTFNRDQLLLRPNIQDVAHSDDAKIITDVIGGIATIEGFKDERSESRVSGTTLAYYVEDVEYFPIYLGAREVGGKIIVDLSHFHPGYGETEKYKRIKQKLITQLSQKFGDRVQLVSDRRLIEIVHDKPPNRSLQPTADGGG